MYHVSPVTGHLCNQPQPQTIPADLLNVTNSTLSRFEVDKIHAKNSVNFVTIPTHIESLSVSCYKILILKEI